MTAAQTGINWSDSRRGVRKTFNVCQTRAAVLTKWPVRTAALDQELPSFTSSSHFSRSWKTTKRWYYHTKQVSNTELVNTLTITSSAAFFCCAHSPQIAFNSEQHAHSKAVRRGQLGLCLQSLTVAIKPKASQRGLVYVFFTDSLEGEAFRPFSSALEHNTDSWRTAAALSDTDPWPRQWRGRKQNFTLGICGIQEDFISILTMQQPASIWFCRVY